MQKSRVSDRARLLFHFGGCDASFSEGRASVNTEHMSQSSWKSRGEVSEGILSGLSVSPWVTFRVFGGIPGGPLWPSPVGIGRFQAPNV